MLFTQGGPQGWGGGSPAPSFFPPPVALGVSAGLAPSQVNGVLPILPLLFPVLWVLATACGEARVLAQMSKASPSSLVSCSRASGRGWGTVQKEPKTGTERQSGLCAQQRGQKCGRPTSCPAAQHTAGPGQLSKGSALSSQQGLQTRPQGRPGVHPPLLSAVRGSGAARCPSPRGVRPPPAHSEALGRWQFLPQDSCPLLHAARQVLGGHSQQLYRSCVLSGTLARMYAGPASPA